MITEIAQIEIKLGTCTMTSTVFGDAKPPMIARGTWLTLTLVTSCLSPHSTDMLGV